MKNRRAKLIAGATVLGLGALGGAAMGTNQGIPASQQLAVSGSGGSVVTSASGTAVAAQAVAGTNATTRPPIVTRASGGGAPAELDD